MTASLWADIAYAVRKLRSAPIFTVTILATLGVGIGATTAIFSVVDGILLQTLPYRDAQRLVAIWEASPKRKIPKFSVSVADFVDWQRQTLAFSGLAASQGHRYVITGDGDAERVLGATVTTNYFDVLGIDLALGRGFARSDSASGSIVLSYGFWARRYGADPNIVGRRIVLDGSSYIVIGVATKRVNVAAQLWTPLNVPPALASARGAHVLSVTGRVKNGISLTAAQKEMTTLASRIASTYPQTNEDWTTLSIPLLEQTVGPVKPALLTLAAAVGLLLLTACVNAAGLTLSRARGRELEIALRSAMGAGRGRIIRQLITESLVVGLASGAVGFGLAGIGVALMRSAAPATIPRMSEVGISTHVLWFALGVALLTAVGFGLVPAVYSARPDLAGVLRGGSRSLTGGRSQRRVQEALVVFQVALAIMLIAGATVLVRTFVSMRNANLGIDPRTVIVAQIALPKARYGTDQTQAQYASSLLARLKTTPGLHTAAVADYLPSVGATPIYQFDVPGRVPRDQTDMPAANAVSVSPAYFTALSIPIKRGRAFTDQDHTGAAPVIIIDETLAQKYYPGVDPVGKQIIIPGDSVRHEIVGMVANVRQGTSDEQAAPTMYSPIAQVPSGQLQLVLRADASFAAIVPEVRRLAGDVDASVPLLDIAPMTLKLAATIAPSRFYAIVAAIFAAIAMLLGAIGLYGILAFTVSQRTREIGIRIALGASPQRVRLGIVGYGMWLAALGIALGTIGAVGLSGLLRGILTAVGRIEPEALIIAAITFVIVGLVGAAVPAGRAARTDPLIAMRGQ